MINTHLNNSSSANERKKTLEYIPFSNKFNVYLKKELVVQSNKANFVFLVGEAGVGKSITLYNEFHKPLKKVCDFIWTFDFVPDNNIGNHFFFKNLLLQISKSLNKPEFILNVTLKAARKSCSALLSQLEHGQSERIFDAEVQDKFIEILKQIRQIRIALFFEDTHWAQNNFANFMELLAKQSQNINAIIICTSRKTKSVHRFNNIENKKLFNLLPLSFSNMSKYTQSIGLKKDNGLINLSQGNPFYLKEVYFLDQQKRIKAKSAERHRENHIVHYKALEGPQAIMLSRVLCLSDDHRKILEILSVMGFDVPYEDVVEFLKLVNVSCSIKDLEYLQQVHLISFDKDAVRFEHHLIYENLSDALLDKYKIDYHDALFSFYRQKNRLCNEYAPRLVHHAHNAGLYSYAAFYSKQLADVFFHRGQYDLSAKYYDEYLKVLPFCSSGAKFSNRVFSVNVNLYQSLLISGDYERSDKIVFYLLNESDRLEDEEKLKLYTVLTTSYWVEGEFDRAIFYAKTTISLAKNIGRRDIEITSLVRAGGICIELGNYCKALDFYSRAKLLIKEGEHFEKFGLFVQAYPNIVSMESLCSVEIGAYQEAESLIEESISLLSEINDDFTAIFTMIHTAYSMAMLGDFNEAHVQLTIAHELCSKENMNLLLPLCKAVMGYCEMHLGDVLVGAKRIECARSMMHKSGHISDRWLVNVLYLESLLIQFDLSGFRSSIDEIIIEAENYTQIGSLGWIYFLQAVYYAFFTDSFTGYVGALAKSNVIAAQFEMKSLSENVQHLMSVGKGGLLSLDNEVKPPEFFSKSKFYEDLTNKVTPLSFHKKTRSSS